MSHPRSGLEGLSNVFSTHLSICSRMFGSKTGNEGLEFINEAAFVQDLIARLRRIVWTILHSEQQRNTFMTWIETSNKNGSFVLGNKPVQIQPKQLLRDLPTRWDSTHQMIKRCISMRLAVDTFLTQPGHNLEHLVLTKKDWDLAHLLIQPVDEDSENLN